MKRLALNHAASARQLTKSQLHTAPRGWFERLLSGPNAPKGFGKFYPGGSTGGASGKTAEGAAEGAAKNAKSSGGSGGGGGGGGGGKKPGAGAPDPDQMANAVVASVITTLVFAYSVLSRKQGTEISSQEFHGALLQSGEIDRIIIANKTTARVVMKAGAAAHNTAANNWRGDLSSSSSKTLENEGNFPRILLRVAFCLNNKQYSFPEFTNILFLTP